MSYSRRHRVHAPSAKSMRWAEDMTYIKLKFMPYIIWGRILKNVGEVHPEVVAEVEVEAEVEAEAEASLLNEQNECIFHRPIIQFKRLKRMHPPLLVRCFDFNDIPPIRIVKKVTSFLAPIATPYLILKKSGTIIKLTNMPKTKAQDLKRFQPTADASSRHCVTKENRLTNVYHLNGAYMTLTLVQL